MVNKANARAYGRFLGKQYGVRRNIIWVLGGDTLVDQPLMTLRGLSRPVLPRVRDRSIVQDAFSGADHIRATRGDDYAFVCAATGKSFTVRPR
jgi:hypothetical protein